jgi:hypothetical protein
MPPRGDIRLTGAFGNGNSVEPVTVAAQAQDPPSRLANAFAGNPTLVQIFDSGGSESNPDAA